MTQLKLTNTLHVKPYSALRLPVISLAFCLLSLGFSLFSVCPSWLACLSGSVSVPVSLPVSLSACQSLSVPLSLPDPFLSPTPPSSFSFSPFLSGFIPDFLSFFSLDLYRTFSLFFSLDISRTFSLFSLWIYTGP